LICGVAVLSMAVKTGIFAGDEADEIRNTALLESDRLRRVVIEAASPVHGENLAGTVAYRQLTL
jgi:hypothetical protein